MSKAEQGCKVTFELESAGGVTSRVEQGDRVTYMARSCSIMAYSVR